LKNDLSDLNDKLVNMEEELFEAKNIQLDLLDQTKALEEKCSLAEEKIHELLDVNEMLEKNQAVYIAKKNDRIDKTLSSYLNKFPEREKLKIMFLRESEGVYQFGQKRVYIKIEKGDQIFVRVGGGFMHIEEFIHLYTAGEVDRIERKDIVQRFHNKVALQTISVNKAVAARETSPIRSPVRARSPKPMRSPGKRIRL